MTGAARGGGGGRTHRSARTGGARGGGIIEIGEREVAVLYTNYALATAERQMGRSVLAVAQGFAEGETSITELAYLLRAGMEAARRDARCGGKSITLPQAFEVLEEAGFVQVAEIVMLALAEVLGYDARDGEEDASDPNLL